MRVGLILISATLLLAGCSGGSNKDRPETAGQKAKAEITLSEDAKKAAKRLPGTLAGDSANAAHTGEAIPPQ